MEERFTVSVDRELAEKLEERASATQLTKGEITRNALRLYFLIQEQRQLGREISATSPSGERAIIPVL